MTHPLLHANSSAPCKSLRSVERRCIRFVLLLSLVALLQACAVTTEQKKWFDRDADGIDNDLDSCPDSLPEHLVNSQGCHLFNGVLDGVQFERNKTDLDDQARAALDELVVSLRLNPDTVVGVYAHTDNRGRASLNLDLSKTRLMSVVLYLVEQGVLADQLKPYAYGESRPLVSNATPEGRERNRRIEVVLLEQ